MIKKAVISAAGMGTRFLPVVKAYSKELIPVLDKPQLQLVVEECIGAGIEEIAVVIRPENKITEKYFSKDENFEKYLASVGKLNLIRSLEEIRSKLKSFVFIPQDANLPYGNGTPILSARTFIGKDNFAYVFGDDLIIEDHPGNYLKQILDIVDEYHAAAVLGCQKVPKIDFNRYGMIKYMTNGIHQNQMEVICEKPEINKSPSEYAVIGRFACQNLIVQKIETQDIGKNSELWFTDTLNTVAADSLVLSQPTEKCVWHTTGDPLRWLIVNIEIAKRDPRYSDQIKKYLKG